MRSEEFVSLHHNIRTDIVPFAEVVTESVDLRERDVSREVSEVALHLLDSVEARSVDARGRHEKVHDTRLRQERSVLSISILKVCSLDLNPGVS